MMPLGFGKAGAAINAAPDQSFRPLLSADQICRQALIRECGELRKELTPRQNGSFDEQFRKPVDELSLGDLRRAVTLCVRAVNRNREAAGIPSEIIP